MNQDATITWSQITEQLSDPVVGGVCGGLALLYLLGFTSIFARAGFHWSLGLLMLIPGLNAILFGLLAFGPWPNGRELKSLRRLESEVSRAKNRFGNAA
ncbi:MAG: hypothetical protein H6831_02570 [Planctomycetes bacterium]|nr:hypothetical protein [Planctomycetota bacterium]MCB9903267.1 hypothetical protein [Planctomycetota bacterium]